MQFGINLLPRKKVTVVQSEALRRIRVLFGAAVAGYLVLLMILLGVSFYLTSAREKIAQESHETEAKIKNLEKKESLALTLKQRMAIVAEVLSSREKNQMDKTSYEALLSWVQSLILPGVVLGEVSFSPNLVVFSGEAANAVVLGEFIEQFQPSQREFSWLVLDSLARSSKGNYSFSLKAQLF